MTRATLEHVNITVSDPARTAALLQDLFGWKQRWEGPAKLGGRTIHVGTDDAYVAVYANGATPPSGRLNHVGIVVDDLDAVEARVLAAGYATHSHGAYEPGRRFYFNDHDDIEFEVVSYA
jgi:predicted enzyme related to lactoylglutathione lyase